MGKGLLDGGLGNLIEDHAANLVWGQVQGGGQMPGNGLPFAVKVRG